MLLVDGTALLTVYKDQLQLKEKLFTCGFHAIYRRNLSNILWSTILNSIRYRRQTTAVGSFI